VWISVSTSMPRNVLDPTNVLLPNVKILKLSMPNRELVKPWHKERERELNYFTIIIIRILYYTNVVDTGCGVILTVYC
jgi:hypothetical protein